MPEGEEQAAAPEAAAAPAAGGADAAPSTSAPAAAGAGGTHAPVATVPPVATPPPAPRQDEGEATAAPGDGGDAGTEPTTAFAAPAFDQSYAWMMQLIILVAAMTFFFPFLRNMFGMKSKKRQVANYTYDSDDECEEDYDESLEEYCEEE